MASGAYIGLDLRQMGKASRLFDVLQKFDRHELLQGVGALAESQTRRRITVEKTSPDGQPWAPWTASYAASRNSGQSLLQGGGALLGSVGNRVDGDAVYVYEATEYAAAHQFGVVTKPHVIKPREKKALFFNGQLVRAVKHPGSKIPARPSLGVSEENGEEIVEEMLAFFDDLIQPVLHQPR